MGLRGREWLFAVLRKWVSLPCPRALRLPRQRVVAGTGGGDVLQQPGEVRCWLRGPSAAVLHAAAAGDVGREGGRGERGVAEGDEVAFRGAGVTASPTQPPGPTSAEPVRGRGRGRGGRAKAARRGAVMASWPPAAVMHAAAACVDCRESGRAGGGGGEGDGVAFRSAGVMASRTLPPGPTFTGPVRLQWLFETNAVLMTRGVFRSGMRRGRQKIPERHTSCPNACSMCMRADDVWKLWASRHLLPPPPPGHGTASSSPSP